MLELNLTQHTHTSGWKAHRHRKNLEKRKRPELSPKGSRNFALDMSWIHLPCTSNKRTNRVLEKSTHKLFHWHTSRLSVILPSGVCCQILFRWLPPPFSSLSSEAHFLFPCVVLEDYIPWWFRVTRMRRMARSKEPLCFEQIIPGLCSRPARPIHPSYSNNVSKSGHPTPLQEFLSF